MMLNDFKEGTVKHDVFSLSDIVEVPEVDMIFAISATAQLDKLANFQQIKEIIIAMIDKYGTGDILYTVIVYGEEPSRFVSFTDDFGSDENLMNVISRMGQRRGANLTKALMLAEEVNSTCYKMTTVSPNCPHCMVATFITTISHYVFLPQEHVYLNVRSFLSLINIICLIVYLF